MNSLVADITAKCTEGTVEGQEEVPASLYDAETAEGQTWYSIIKGDSNVGSGLSITDVNGITATFSSEITDWRTGGSNSDAREVDGVRLTGCYAQSDQTNGAPVIFTTTKAGTLTVFFGGGIATNKSINMTDSDGNGLTGSVLGSGEEIANGQKPSTEIPAWDGISYTLEADNAYSFFAGGTKWRLAGFRYTTNGTTAIPGITTRDYDGAVYDLTGRKVAPYNHSRLPKGIYLMNGKKVIVK